MRAFLEAVDTAIRASQPQHAMSATQRAWLAFCVYEGKDPQEARRPPPQRPPTPAPNPPKQQLALRLLEEFKGHHPDIRSHCITADALYGTAPFVDSASALFGGVQVLWHIRGKQNIRVGKRAQHVADYCATHPGTPHRLRIRGGAERVTMVGSARFYVCSHHTKRFIVAVVSLALASQPDELGCDLWAAPGSKTSYLAQ